MGRFGTSWENSRVKSMLCQGLMHRSKGRRYSITSSAAFAERDVMECRAFESLGLMPADLITLAHLSVSLAMNFANSSGENGIDSMPSSTKLACDLGSPRA